MGGIGSGRRWTGTARYLTTDFPSLDIRRLQGAGLLLAGHTFAWAYQGERWPRILARPQADFVEIYHRTMNGTWDANSGLLMLDWTLCSHGGRRAWFLCPEAECGRRVGILYAKRGGTYACRHCLNLAYPSQREREAGRARLKAEAIRARLGWTPGLLNPNGDKPARMRTTTFRRLVDQHERLVETALWGMMKVAAPGLLPRMA